ncbi:MAG: hypothetical protein IJS54_04190 [Desulfovibrio sp.]|nr:hypothetical protein [Desulfovibrio sp.]
MLGRMCLFLCVLISAIPAFAFDGGEKVPPYTRDEGRVNLNYDWVVHHGARTYWRSVNVPNQVKLEGMRFRDPSDIPQCLDLNDTCSRAKKKYSRGKRLARKKVISVKRPKVIAQAKKSNKVPPQKTSYKLGPAQKRSALPALQAKPVDPVGVPLQ